MKLVESSNFSEIEQKHKLTEKSMEKLISDECLCSMTIYFKYLYSDYNVIIYNFKNISKNNKNKNLTLLELSIIPSMSILIVFWGSPNSYSQLSWEALVANPPACFFFHFLTETYSDKKVILDILLKEMWIYMKYIYIFTDCIFTNRLWFCHIVHNWAIGNMVYQQ